LITFLDCKSYAYSTLILEEKEIQELGEVLEPYANLINVNLSKNDIRDVGTLLNMPSLVNLNASTNQIASIMFLAIEGALPFLQVLGSE